MERGKKRTIIITLSTGLVILVRSMGLAWEPPIGIPRPEFGIEETYRMYDVPANRNPELTYYQNAEGGLYTHYVDNDDLNATNTDNPYGTIAKPRLTIPYPVPEGSVVEVHGTEYTYNQGGAVRIKGWTGTSSKPIFIRGTVTENHPYFTYPFTIEGEYVILEKLSGRGVWVRGEFAGSDRDTDHVCVRSCDFYHTAEGSGGIVVTDTQNKTYSVESSHVVVYNNKVHDFGHLDLDEDEDCGGIAATSRDVWIVDNEVYNTSGSGMQFAGPESERIYVGRNHIYNTRQAGIAYKYGANHVYSQNTIHDIIHTRWSPSKGINLQYGSGPVWIIFNEIYNTVVGINAGDTKGTPADSHFYMIGNLIHDTVSIAEAVQPIEYSQEWIDEQEALAWKGISFWLTSNFYIISNTIDGYRGGIYSGGSLVESLGGKVFNNIVTNNTGAGYHFDTNYGGTFGSVVENNLFWQGGDDISLSWGNSDYTAIATFQSASETGNNCIIADPQFADPSANDFHLQPESPAIDAGTSSGVVQEVFDRFEQLYGIDIRKDIEGGIRPYGAEWDIGAYEWGSTPADPDSDIDTQPEPDAEPEAVIPAETKLLVMNNVLKTGGNQSALIRCDMKEAGRLTVQIYNAKGREIITLCDEERQAGRHEFVWEGKDASGNPVGSGIYLVHMKSGGYTETKKIAVVK